MTSCRLLSVGEKRNSMAQTTVYTCDICKGSKDRNDLAKIEVKVEGLRIKGVDRYTSLKTDICKE